MKRYLYTHVHSSIIHKSQKMEPTCPSENKWINKLWYIHTMEYYLSLKRKETDICYNIDEYYVRLNKPIAKRHTVREVSRLVKLIQTENRMVVDGAGQGGGGWIRSCLMGTELQFCKMILEIGIQQWIYLTPLNYTFKNGYDSKSYGWVKWKSLSCVWLFATPWIIQSMEFSRQECWRGGVGNHALLQGIFPTQGSNPGLLHCRGILYSLSHHGSPMWCVFDCN